MNFLRTLLTPLSPSPFCLDIGANEGGYIWSILQARPQAFIHAFEPLRHFYKLTDRRFADASKVHVFPVGVSNVCEYVPEMQVHEAWTLARPGTAVKGRNAESLAREGADPFPVTFTTIDAHLAHFATFRTVPPVEFMKIDTDGYEFRVLQGAQQTIQKDRPLILIEISYMVQDIGDSVVEFLELIYGELNYQLITQDGRYLTQQAMYDHYPWHTSFDVAMVPAERVPSLPILD